MLMDTTLCPDKTAPSVAPHTTLLSKVQCALGALRPLICYIGLQSIRNPEA